MKTLSKCFHLVPRAGLEPARHLWREILSLLCLPISPPRQIGRSSRIRTYDPLLPKQMRYQTALHSENLINEFDLSHRDLDFRYDEFCLTNSFETFLEKDKQGYYNFN